MTISLIHSKKALLAAALLAVPLLSLVMVAYAEVTVGNLAPLQGTVKYSLDNAEVGTWNTTLAPNGPFASWYSKLGINGARYKGLTLMPGLFVVSSCANTNSSDWHSFMVR